MWGTRLMVAQEGEGGPTLPSTHPHAGKYVLPHHRPPPFSLPAPTYTTPTSCPLSPRPPLPRTLASNPLMESKPMSRPLPTLMNLCMCVGACEAGWGGVMAIPLRQQPPPPPPPPPRLCDAMHGRLRPWRHRAAYFVNCTHVPTRADATPPHSLLELGATPPQRGVVARIDILADVEPCGGLGHSPSSHHKQLVPDVGVSVVKAHWVVCVCGVCGGGVGGGGVVLVTTART